MRARDNPFRAERLHGLAYRAPGFDWTRLLARLRGQAWRGALRGPCGSGKSTLLRQLGQRLEGHGWTVVHERLDPGEPAKVLRSACRLAEAARPEVALLVDGADRLGAGRWLLLRWRTRRAGALVITTHREGRLPTLRRCVASPAVLRSLLHELEPGGTQEGRDAERLLLAHGGNLRGVFWELYDRRAGA